ncbi:MAG TPA: polysaccharide biosynthesis/export family protein [Pyrinomonadaceae bacterium]|nr:polysaccharide biosynthesis/export family protein [Pyrinomonadaceae bacterium]
MKKTVLVIILLIAPAIVSAQNQTRERRSTQAPKTEQSSARDRVVNAKALNHVNNSSAVPAVAGSSTSVEKSSPADSQQAWGNVPVNVRPIEIVKASTPQVASNVPANSSSQGKVLVKPTSLSTPQPINVARGANSLRDPVSTSNYAVGIGDVLDVRLSNLSTRESTLFTVMRDGTLEYPLVGNPIRVVGMTTDDIARLLANQIKVLNAPRVSVSVRDYASHGVMVTGAVGNPGRKTLRREAVPLFALLAESMVNPEATLAIITHNGKDGSPISLKDDKAMATPVVSGDVIRITGSASESTKKFVYISGNVVAPGEKMFRDGMTLTQAVITAGGVQRSTGNNVKVSRQNQTGLLTAREYDLNAISEGKAQDPQLQAGDRIEVNQKM